MTEEAIQLSFAPLSAEATEEFADARNFISSLAQKFSHGAVLEQTQADLPILQALVDLPQMRHANYEAWVALGICFGDVLVSIIPRMAWRLVTDQFGTAATLQYSNKAISIAAPFMLWKRKERGDDIDLNHMAEFLKSYIEENGEAAADA